jgi:hypothetical protein
MKERVVDVVNVFLNGGMSLLSDQHTFKRIEVLEGQVELLKDRNRSLAIRLKTLLGSDEFDEEIESYQEDE